MKVESLEKRYEYNQQTHQNGNGENVSYDLTQDV